MNDIYILCGPAGSGKSTWIKEHRKDNDFVISRDEIRFVLMDMFNTNYFDNEDSVIQVFYQAIRNSTAFHINEGRDIYIDATHLNNRVRKTTLDNIMGKEYWTIHFVNFIVSVDTCLAQNAKREGRARVPDDVIRGMCAHFIPAKNEKYDCFDICEEPTQIYLTSDLHFNHNKEFLYKPRGFNSPEEHDEGIIKNWNETIRDKDTVFILGDIGMTANHEYLAYCVNRLAGRIIWIRGNHDTDKKVEYIKEHCPNVMLVSYAEMLQYRKHSFFLSHYPTAVGNYDDEEKHNKFYSLCGHSHTKNKWQDFNTMKSYHVELDAHNNHPVNIETIIYDIRSYNNEP